MIKYICRKLAECYGAHLSDEEKRFSEAIRRLRDSVNEFNSAAEAVCKFKKSSVWVYTQEYRSPESHRVEYFRLGKVSATLNQPKAV